jgi:hypothetical protein
MRIRRTFCWAAIALLLMNLAVAFAPALTNSAYADTLSNTVAKLKGKQLISFAISCIGSGNWTNDSNANSGDFFYTPDGATTVNIEAGYWFGTGGMNSTVQTGWAMEARIGNSGDSTNGKIYCGENGNAIMTQLKDFFGISFNDNFRQNSDVLTSTNGTRWKAATGYADALRKWIADNASRNEMSVSEQTSMSIADYYVLYTDVLNSPQCSGNTKEVSYYVYEGNKVQQITRRIGSRTSSEPAGNPTALSSTVTCEGAADKLSDSRYAEAVAEVVISLSVSSVTINSNGDEQFVTLYRQFGSAGDKVAVNPTEMSRTDDWIGYNSNYNGQTKIRIYTAPRTGSQRQGTVTVKYGTATLVLTVTQQGTTTSSLSLNPSEMSFSSASGSQVTIVSYTNLSGDTTEVTPSADPTSDSDWITATRDPSTSTVTVQVAANIDPTGNATPERSGTVTVKYGTSTAVLVVTQAGEDTNFVDPNAPGSSASTAAKTCDLGKFGWVICGLMDAVDWALGGLYGIIEGFLQVPRAIMDTGSGTFRAWGTFRDIANIIFIILFLFVIFSQITGVGINNYGIKKIFPQLLTTAVLINLSFFFCQAAVDVSNIVGSQGKVMLENLGRNAGSGTCTVVGSADPGTCRVGEGFPVTDVSTGDLSTSGVIGGGDPDQSGHPFIATMLSVLGIVGVGLGAFLVLGGGWGILIAIIGVLISGLVAGVTILAILTIRQVGVVLLVVLSPVAFATRLLPNTDSLFKKWLNAFKTLLVVYPVAGLVMGGGLLAGKIIANVDSNNFLFAVAGLACTVLPFFMVVSITKGALNGLGKLGGTIAGKLNQAGGKLNQGAQGLQHKALDPFKERNAAKVAAGGGKGLDKIRSGLAKKGFERQQKTADIKAASAGGYKGDNEKLQAMNTDSQARLGVYQGNGQTEAEMTAAVAAGTMKQKDMDREMKLRANSKTNKEAIRTAGGSRSFEGKIRSAGIAAANKEEKALIEDMTTDLESTYGNNMAGLETEFASALRDGDDIKTKAIANMMISKGGAGIGAIDRQLINAERDIDPSDAKYKKSRGALIKTLNSDVNQREVSKKNAGLASWAAGVNKDEELVFDSDGNAVIDPATGQQKRVDNPHQSSNYAQVSDVRTAEGQDAQRWVRNNKTTTTGDLWKQSGSALKRLLTNGDAGNAALAMSMITDAQAGRNGAEIQMDRAASVGAGLAQSAANVSAFEAATGQTYQNNNAGNEAVFDYFRNNPSAATGGAPTPGDTTAPLVDTPAPGGAPIITPGPGGMPIPGPGGAPAPIPVPIPAPRPTISSASMSALNSNFDALPTEVQEIFTRPEPGAAPQLGTPAPNGQVNISQAEADVLNQHFDQLPEAVQEVLTRPDLNPAPIPVPVGGGNPSAAPAPIPLTAPAPVSVSGSAPADNGAPLFTAPSNAPAPTPTPAAAPQPQVRQLYGADGQVISNVEVNQPRFVPASQTTQSSPSASQQSGPIISQPSFDPQSQQNNPQPSPIVTSPVFDPRNGQHVGQAVFIPNGGFQPSPTPTQPTSQTTPASTPTPPPAQPSSRSSSGSSPHSTTNRQPVTPLSDASTTRQNQILNDNFDNLPEHVQDALTRPDNQNGPRL